ncbi:hypothetical protein L1887_03663 [Cichorium endivia]|nr:hypothetical protein L1887_03663 [Cichorium endivia]
MKLTSLSGSAVNSNEESSVSEQCPSGELGFKYQKESDSRKLKVISSKGTRSTTKHPFDFYTLHKTLNGVVSSPVAMEFRNQWKLKNVGNSFADYIKDDGIPDFACFHRSLAVPISPDKQRHS